MTKLYPYQISDVKQIIRYKGRALLALEMGLGKTLVALTYARIRPKLRPVLVVCPASAKWVWAAEIRKHTKLTYRVLNGKKAKRYRRIPDITIINYEILDSWKARLRDVGYRIMILDECHYTKNWKAKRTRAVFSIGKVTDHVLALSGTPLMNRPKELYNTLKLLLPKRFKSFVPFAHRYCNRRITPWGWNDNGASHLDELHEILSKTCMIRHTKKEVLKELPPKQRSIVPLPIVNSSEYIKAEKQFIDWLKKKDANKAKRAMNAERITQMGYLKRLAAELKMKATMEWIDNFLQETDEKLVLFAYHKDIIQQLKTKYKNICTVVDGSTSSKQKAKNVEQFQKSKKTRLFIGQLIAAGTAITLTAASNIAFVELDWVPGNHIQAEDRCHRIGQKNHVQIYYLIARNTVEQELCLAIQKKAKIISAVLDGKATTDFDIFDEIILALEAAKRILKN